MSQAETAEQRYADFYPHQAASVTLRRIYQQVYGDDYPDELEPFGFVTRTDLARLSEVLSLRSGQLLVDVGCGRGGPGIAVAKAAGARLIGLDVVDSALAGAAAAARRLGLAGAEFRRASFTTTGLDAASCDAVMSVDVLWMVWNKQAAIAEIARVLRPGGRFAFTTWEPGYVDHARILTRAGFVVDVREETAGWLHRQRSVYASILRHREQLEQELGAGAEVIIAEARDTPATLADTPRMLFVATLPGRPPVGGGPR
ncbi:class I SAM-dependent methyltransferase [Solwaraspora sp. WMMB335]|uniref:class I SAM-dependent methyltransferase n=1 Tax=Solwaraspora sp. WMMB335 TaxID=3404118 RepID=UPI003B92DC83